jgi:protein TonB
MRNLTLSVSHTGLFRIVAWVLLVHGLLLSMLWWSSHDLERLTPKGSIDLEMVMASPTPEKPVRASPQTPAPHRRQEIAPSSTRLTREPDETTTWPSDTYPSDNAVASDAASVVDEPVLTLPSSHAPGLNNPQPNYPSLSRRLHEQGLVIIRVWVTPQGQAQRGEISTSSGFDRLDQEALQTVLRWRFTPGKRLGKPDAMWFNVPVHFVLK